MLRAAKLWLAPAEPGFHRDVDALVEGSHRTASKSVGADVKADQGPGPTLFYPSRLCASPARWLTLAWPSENQMRLLLWSVERSIAGLCAPT